MTADFHNHSCVSPCATLEMSPRVLAETAAAKGIGILALTDHNTSLNCPAFGFHCKRLGIIPLYGIEVTAREEAHLLALFSVLDAALSFGEYIYSILTPFLNNPEKTGDQVYVDEDDNILGELEYFLPNAADVGIDELGPKTAEYGGIVIPAHVDRPAFSMYSQLGLIVTGPWAALECVRIPPILGVGPESPVLDTLGFPLTISSDAHNVEHIGRRTFILDAPADELLPNGPGGDADMEALKRALSRRPRK